MRKKKSIKLLVGLNILRTEKKTASATKRFVYADSSSLTNFNVYFMWICIYIEDGYRYHIAINVQEKRKYFLQNLTSCDLKRKCTEEHTLYIVGSLLDC